LAAGGQAVVVVEQNIDRSLPVADRICVMDDGQMKVEREASDLSLGWAAKAH
jgi:ABC-type branched-subunit amino acid transport system ATPase component